LPDKDVERLERAATTAGKVQSPPARFVQVRARFQRDPGAVVSQVVLPFLTDNVRARW